MTYSDDEVWEFFKQNIERYKNKVLYIIGNIIRMDMEEEIGR